MTIEFDDLIPRNATSIEFDDLIPGDRPRWMDHADQLMASTAEPAKPAGRQSVLEDAPADPSKFNFRAASVLNRLLDEQTGRQAKYGTIDPVVGPKASAGTVASGLLSDFVSGGKAARAGINQMAGDLTGSQRLLDQARSEAGQADLMRAMTTPDFESPEAAGIYSGVSSTVRQLPSIAAAIATRSPNIALSGMVAPMVPEEYGKFRQRGGAPMASMAASLGSAATEYVTEKMPMGFLVKQFGKAGAGQFLTGLLAREVPGEQVATLVQDAIDTAVANPDKTWGDYLAERPDAAYQTLLATLTQGGVMGGANAVAGRFTPQPPTQPPPPPAPKAPALADYQDAMRQTFGAQKPAPTQQPTQPAPDVISRILQAIEQTQNGQDPQTGNAPVLSTESPQAAAVEAPAAAPVAAPPVAGVPAEPAAPRVEAAGLSFDDLVPDAAQPPILQNRNRATPSSIAQMQGIAAQPDYGRLGFSRDFANGAPVVAGGQVAPEQLGRKDMAVASDGRRITVQYAVVEADDVLPSNQADGTPNADYGNQAVQRIRAIAGNGRVAGLQQAYRKGTTQGYVNELAADALHGVSPDVIGRMRAPVLVRVMPSDQVSDDIGDVSNTTGNLNLSAVEQANNDAQRVSLDALQFAQDGSITAEAVRQFVRAMPQAEQGGLIDTNGQPTKQAVDRINAAVFAKAYGNDQLIRLFAQAQDPEARNVLSALAQVAPKMARLEGLGALDIRDVVTQAAEIAVNARREGKPMALAAQQLDMAADPLVGVVLDLFAANPRSVKPVVQALGNAADFAYTEATKPAEDMFGTVPRAGRADVINQLRPENEQASEENLEQPAGRGPVQGDVGRPAAQPAAAADAQAAQAGRPAEAEGLTSYTPEEVTQRLERAGSDRAADASQAYNAEAPRRKYTDDRQLQLFLDSEPDPSQTGPAADRARREAVAAVDDLRSTQTLLAQALSGDYAARQRASLVGQKVGSAEDLAVLAQVYRDPRFETFRVVFVNDGGAVVSQVGLTSRLPSSTAAIMGSDIDAYLKDLSATARNRGASGYYLLHNHPTGIPTPSRADMALTQQFAQKMPMLEFKSHVVIDTNEYSTIDGNGAPKKFKKDFGQSAPYLAAEWVDVTITGPGDVMAMAKRLQVDEGAVTLIHTDAQYNVKSISTIPAEATLGGIQAVQRQIAKASLKARGASVFAVSRNSTALLRVGSFVRDGIHVTADGGVRSLAATGEIAGGEPFPRNRNTRLSPDTSPEFGYLRQGSQQATAQRAAEPGPDTRESTAPNGGTSNQTDTPAFKKWFGDSKVVDADGNPLVVYHGTPNASFTEFNEGAHFTEDPDYAAIYTNPSASSINSKAKRSAAPAIMPVYLSIKKPFDTRMPDVRRVFEKEFFGKWGNGTELSERGLPDWTDGRDLLEWIEETGQPYDGILIDEGGTPEGGHRGLSWVPVKNTQIKSATGNNGNFDGANQSIVREDAPQYDAKPDPDRANPNRDALGRIKFRLGEVALGKLDAATRPLQERFGMRLASPELRRQLRQMKATIDEAKRKAVDVAKEMNAMSEDDRAMVSDIVEKMVAPGVVPPEHAVKVADAITKTMDQQTDELVALGMLSKDSAERWRGRYLPRMYNRQTELADDPLIKRLFKTGAPTMQGIGGGSLKGRGLFQDVSVDAVDNWLAMGYEVRDPHWILNQGKLELKDPNAPKVAREQVTVWRDWTPSERAQMGENRDALYRFVQGYTRMQGDIALGRLFNNIANNTDWVRRSAAEGWVKVPDTEIPDTGGVKRYGNLAGLYVRQDVMSHLSRFEEAASDSMQLYREALGLWKEGKTALNPVAHFNNVMGNINMAHFAGVSYWDADKYINAARDMTKDAPMLEEARKVGLFTGSFTKEEIAQSMPPELQKLMALEEGKARKAGKQVMNAMTFWLRKPLSNAYEFEDSFFKYLIYRDARQHGMAADEAMDYALRYIFTYDDLPSGARKVRDYAVPFFSWTYKAFPALLHTAMVYPWRFLAPAAALHGINLVAYALAAGDEDDDWLEKIAKGRALEQEERAALPEHTAGMGLLLNPKTIRLGTDGVTGNPIFLDASRVVPGGDMFDMENQAGGVPLPAPLMPNHPILSAFAAMLANKEMFMGREVTDKNDTALEASEKRAKWMAGLLMPAVSPGGYHSQRIAAATAHAMDTVITTPLGEFTGVDRSGQPVQPKYAAMQTLGIKARPTDLALEAQRKKARESAFVNSIAAEVRSMARLHQKGAVTDGMMDRTRESAREKIERLRDE